MFLLTKLFVAVVLRRVNILSRHVEMFRDWRVRLLTPAFLPPCLFAVVMRIPQGISVIPEKKAGE